MMARTDAKDLKNDSLPTGTFPVDPRSDFRLHISPKVRSGIQQHAQADTSVEICGVLVGNWHRDENGPYADITDYIRCDNASSKSAEVTFTHESWAQINKEMDSRFQNARIIGWYHSHPDFGIFLSDRDCFIHEHFFSSPGQVAYVVDPVRGLEGMFGWSGGKLAPLPHFWVGNEIRTVEASQRNVGAETSKGSMGELTSHQNAPPPSITNSSLGFATTALGLLAIFVFGYLYGGWNSRLQTQMMFEGAVAHFADAKVIREGLETELASVRTRLGVLTQELDKLPKPDTELSKEQSEEATARRKLLHDNLVLCSSALERIEQVYGLSHVERAVLAQIAVRKQAELRRMEEEAAAPKRQAAPNAKQPAPEKSTQPPAASSDPKSRKPAAPNDSQPAPADSTAK
jgi:proteasome lid subunit RPN8/RPN11